MVESDIGSIVKVQILGFWGLDQIKRIIEIRKENLYDVKNYSKEVIEKIINDLTVDNFIEKTKNRLIFIATDKNNYIIGNASLLNNEIKMMYVDKNYQKKGIGKEIIKNIEKIAIKLKYKELKVYSAITAQKFYEKQNFKFISEEIKENDFRKILMIKQL